MVRVEGSLHDFVGFWSHGSGLDGVGSLVCLYLVELPESGCNSSSIQWDVLPSSLWWLSLPMRWMSCYCWCFGKWGPYIRWVDSRPCLLRNDSSQLPLDVFECLGVLEIVCWVVVESCCCKMIWVLLLLWLWFDWGYQGGWGMPLFWLSFVLCCFHFRCMLESDRDRLWILLSIWLRLGDCRGE